METVTEVKSDIKHLVNFRQTLHQNPELSGYEEYTAEALKRTIIRYQPDDIIDGLGGFGVAFVFRGREDGPTLLFRADMDALPILESNDFDYSSRTENVAHQCGHDGHMAILVGVAKQISKNRPKAGKVVLLFQPAEETGEGAIAVLNDPNFHRIEPNLCFALHNIPGYPKGAILLKNGIFSAASKGLTVKLKGKTSHAAEPGKGISPAIAMAKIMERITKLPEKENLFSEFVLATIVHAKLGERTFGTTPGNAEIMITLRSLNDEDMDVLLEHTKSVIYLISKGENLIADISCTDIYPTMANNASLNQKVKEAAKQCNIPTIKVEQPFPWAEDFANFALKYKSVMFGIGAGEDAPKLHNADYNFPDDIIENGVNIFTEIYTKFFSNCLDNEY